MLIEGIRKEEDVRNLNGFKNIIIGGVATSIDALAVGVSMSMDSLPWEQMRSQAIAVFLCTAASVLAGIWGGKTVGKMVGPVTEIIGGVVLIAIGIGILI